VVKLRLGIVAKEEENGDNSLYFSPPPSLLMGIKPLMIKSTSLLSNQVKKMSPRHKN